MAVSTRSKSSSNDGSISKVKNSDTNNKTKITKISTSTPSIAWIDIFFFIILVLLSIFTYPSDFLTGHIKHVPISFVWYYGWITAVSTGLGALPFIFFKEPTKFWLGVSNAIAGGMMIAASYSLVMEGFFFDLEISKVAESVFQSSATSTFVGFAVGVIFLIATKVVLDRFESVELSDISSADLNKMFLIIFVMTLHSLTEGIGIGVSFGGHTGMQFGPFVSLSLALHNVPEGLAVALVLSQRKVNVLRAGLWAVFTSLPQPLTAIPAFLFVERFSQLLPLGLGFAAGAMTYVAIFELLTEAIEDSGFIVTSLVGVLSCAIMTGLQHGLKNIL